MKRVHLGGITLTFIFFFVSGPKFTGFFRARLFVCCVCLLEDQDSSKVVRVSAELSVCESRPLVVRSVLFHNGLLISQYCVLLFCSCPNHYNIAVLLHIFRRLWSELLILIIQTLCIQYTNIWQRPAYSIRS